MWKIRRPNTLLVMASCTKKWKTIIWTNLDGSSSVIQNMKNRYIKNSSEWPLLWQESTGIYWHPSSSKPNLNFLSQYIVQQTWINVTNMKFPLTIHILRHVTHSYSKEPAYENVKCLKTCENVSSEIKPNVIRTDK